MCDWVEWRNNGLRRKRTKHILSLRWRSYNRFACLYRYYGCRCLVYLSCILWAHRKTIYYFIFHLFLLSFSGFLLDFFLFHSHVRQIQRRRRRHCSLMVRRIAFLDLWHRPTHLMLLTVVCACACIWCSRFHWDEKNIFRMRHHPFNSIYDFYLCFSYVHCSVYIRCNLH